MPHAIPQTHSSFYRCRKNSHKNALPPIGRKIRILQPGAYWKTLLLISCFVFREKLELAVIHKLQSRSAIKWAQTLRLCSSAMRAQNMVPRSPNFWLRDIQQKGRLLTVEFAQAVHADSIMFRTKRPGCWNLYDSFKQYRPRPGHKNRDLSLDNYFRALRTTTYMQ